MATRKAKTSQAKSVKKTNAKSKVPAAKKSAAKSSATKSARAKAKPVADQKAVKAKSAKPKAAARKKAPALPKPPAANVPSAVAANSRLVELAQANVHASLELARNLAGARTPMEAMRLGIAYWYDNMHAARAQAQAFGELSAAVVASASAPLRKQISRT